MEGPSLPFSELGRASGGDWKRDNNLFPSRQYDFPKREEFRSCSIVCRIAVWLCLECTVGYDNKTQLGSALRLA